MTAVLCAAVVVVLIACLFMSHEVAAHGGAGHGVGRPMAAAMPGVPAQHDLPAHSGGPSTDNCSLLDVLRCVPTGGAPGGLLALLVLLAGISTFGGSVAITRPLALPSYRPGGGSLLVPAGSGPAGVCPFLCVWRT
jgi:hypothetical protein